MVWENHQLCYDFLNQAKAEQEDVANYYFLEVYMGYLLCCTKIFKE